MADQNKKMTEQEAINLADQMIENIESKRHVKRDIVAASLNKLSEIKGDEVGF